MNKSVIVTIIIAWLLLAFYVTLTRLYHYPYGEFAMVGSWIMSVLLLVCVILYIRKHKKSL
jgi:hypothetical protein